MCLFSKRIFLHASFGDAFDSILRWKDKDKKLIIIIIISSIIKEEGM